MPWRGIILIAEARELDERGIPAELDEAVSARELDERTPHKQSAVWEAENKAHISVSPPKGVMSTAENKKNPANKRRHPAFVQYADNHKKKKKDKI